MTADDASNPAFDPCLLTAATTLGGELDLPGLATRLGPLLVGGPEVRFAVLGAFESERGLFRGVLLPMDAGARANPEPFLVPAADIATRLTGARPREEPAILEWDSPFCQALQRQAPVSGATVALVSGLRLGERLIGALLIGMPDRGTATAPWSAFLRRLSTIVAPVLWNCITEERLARGDRRRDALLALYQSINTPLRMDGVLATAHAVLTELAGPEATSIDLFEEDERTYRAYGGAPGAGGDPSGAVGGADGAVLRGFSPRREIAGSALVHIQLRGTTYVSNDLAVHAQFDSDHDWLARGIRRYVATPLRARRRLLGALVIGARDPHPVLQIDVWLYENIALQIALALDNARQHEEVRRLSDRLREQNVYLREEIQREHDFAEMIGRTPALARVRADIARVAPTEATALIAGETGVGKELVARAIHAASARAMQPMVKVNCAAIPEGLVESELFGHERGAFTSAVERRIGRFELAIDGALFLDEVGEQPLSVQSKLLRVLQDGEFERVGGTKTLKTNARILAATNRSLLAEVEAGRFRRDLYYRLNVFPVNIPSLCERRADIPLLVEAFVGQFARRMGKHIETIDPTCLAELAQRDWPGNIRERRHAAERAMILCDGPILRIESATSPPPRASTAQVADDGPAPLPPRPGARAPALKAIETEMIRNALERANWIVEEPRGAAHLLEMTPSTLRYRMKRLGIHRP